MDRVGYSFQTTFENEWHRRRRGLLSSMMNDRSFFQVKTTRLECIMGGEPRTAFQRLNSPSFLTPHMRECAAAHMRLKGHIKALIGFSFLLDDRPPCTQPFFRQRQWWWYVSPIDSTEELFSTTSSSSTLSIPVGIRGLRSTICSSASSHFPPWANITHNWCIKIALLLQDHGESLSEW